MDYRQPPSSNPRVALPARGSHPRNLAHYIQFYSAEVALFDAISAFVLPTFFSSEHAAIIVATKPHLDALSIYLRTNNLAPEALKKRDQLYLTPAEPILDHLTPDGKVSEERFFAYFGPLFEKIQRRYPRLLVYGELVNMLCDKEQHQEALDLEQIWEVFLAGRDASLLCGYDMNVFATDGLEDIFQKICRSHSRITPAESAEGSGPPLTRPGDQQLVLAMLQQKSLRLATEMNKRAAIEAALQATLDHLGNRPQDAILVQDKCSEPKHINMAAVGIVAATVSDDGQTEYFVNSKFLELSGLTDRMVRTDGGWVAAVHYQDRERTTHNLRLADGKSRRSEYRFVLPNGTLRWISGESVARDSGYVHTAVDISQFRQGDHERSRTGSVANDPLFLDDPNNPTGTPTSTPGLELRKRSLAMSSDHSGRRRRRSMSVPVGHVIGGLLPSLLNRASSRDLEIATEVSRICQILYDVLSPQPVVSDEHVHWARSLHTDFHPHLKGFNEANDDNQKNYLRLAHIAFLVCIVISSLGGGVAFTPTTPRMGSGAGSPPREIIPRELPEHPQPPTAGAADSAMKALKLLMQLSSPFTDTRLAVRCFYVTALTLLLHISSRQIPPTHMPSLLDLISHNLAVLPDAAEEYESELHPYTLAACKPASYEMQSQLGGGTEVVSEVVRKGQQWVPALTGDENTAMGVWEKLKIAVKWPAWSGGGSGRWGPDDLLCRTRATPLEGGENDTGVGPRHNEKGKRVRRSDAGLPWMGGDEDDDCDVDAEGDEDDEEYLYTGDGRDGEERRRAERAERAERAIRRQQEREGRGGEAWGMSKELEALFGGTGGSEMMGNNQNQNPAQNQGQDPQQQNSQRQHEGINNSYERHRAQQSNYERHRAQQERNRALQ